MIARIIAAARRLAARQPKPETKPVWFPLPGNMLELGVTGYRIELTPEDERHDMRLFSPEGLFICGARDWQLDELKAMAEKSAKNRAEFAPGEVWKP